MMKLGILFFVSALTLLQSIQASAFWFDDPTEDFEMSADQIILDKIKTLQEQITTGAVDVRDVLVDNKEEMIVGGSGSVIAGIVVQKLGKVTIQNSEQIMAKSAADLVKVASTYIGQVNGTAGRMVNIVETAGADIMLAEGTKVVTRSQMRNALLKGALIGLRDLAIDYGYRGVIFLGRGMVIAGAVSSGIGTSVFAADLLVQTLAGKNLNVGESGELYFASASDFKSRFTLSSPKEILALYKDDPQFKSRFDSLQLDTP